MNENKTGLELITKERMEQLTKHGYDVHHDVVNNANGELIKAAQYCLDPEESADYPYGWGNAFGYKIEYYKNKIQRLIVAGALIAAEIDRIFGQIEEGMSLEGKKPPENVI